jgi:hypothetical protein
MGAYYYFALTTTRNEYKVVDASLSIGMVQKAAKDNPVDVEFAFR